MQKFENNVALENVIFSIEKRISKNGYPYYVLIAHADNQDIVCCFISKEQQLDIYKVGVDIR